MRVIQAVGWYYPENLGGTEVYVSGLCNRLQKAGHDVVVAAPDPSSSFERTYQHDGITIYRYPTTPSPTREECHELLPTRGAECFHRWVVDQRPDVVHFHTFVTGLGLHEVIAAKATGARVIVTTHSSSLGYICQRGTLMQRGKEPCDGICNPLKCATCELQHKGLPIPLAYVAARIPPAWGLRSLSIPGKAGTALGMSYLIAHNQRKQQQLLRYIDKFVLLTQWAWNTVLLNGAPVEKLALNRLGLSQEHFSRKPGPDVLPTQLPIKIGYLGRFERIKGVLVLAKAIASLPRELPVMIELRGPAHSAYEQEVINEIREIVGDDPRVSIAPAVSVDTALEVLASYDVLCCPSVCLEGGADCGY